MASDSDASNLDLSKLFALRICSQAIHSARARILPVISSSWAYMFSKAIVCRLKTTPRSWYR